MDHQAGIFEEGAIHHIFLEFALAGAPEALPGASLAGAEVPGGSQVIAFGAAAAGRLGLPAPAGFSDFAAVDGIEGFAAPATQADAFIWLHGRRRDELFARALEWRDALMLGAAMVREEHGFVFRDSRDLTGFIDGTANPKEDARQAAALIPEGACAGGSFVLAQRWVHHLFGFAALATGDQERVFGRTRADSIELTGDAMPPDSHVSRTDLPGTKIYRRSAPVGGVRDPGLFFLAFSAEQERFSRLLGSMFGLAGDGLRDRMLSYSRPLSGAFYYAPPPSHLSAVFAD